MLNKIGLTLIGMVFLVALSNLIYLMATNDNVLWIIFMIAIFGLLILMSYSLGGLMWELWMSDLFKKINNKGKKKKTF